MFVGAKRFLCLIGWRQNQSQQLVTGSACGKGGDLRGKSKWPTSNAVPKGEAERSHLGRCAIRKAKEDHLTATSRVDMSRARSLKKDGEISCCK